MKDDLSTLGIPHRGSHEAELNAGRYLHTGLSAVHMECGVPHIPGVIVMKRLRISLLLSALAICCASTGAFAQATTSANASATIVTAISMSKTADLDFGNVVAGGSAGTVVMSAAGSRSATGGASLGNAGSAAAAGFTVSGQASATYAITLPSATTITSGGNNMTVNTFTSSPSGTGTLSGGGSQSLAVGATLQVGTSQATGSYTGSFNVTVAYN